MPVRLWWKGGLRGMTPNFKDRILNPNKKNSF